MRCAHVDVNGLTQLLISLIKLTPNEYTGESVVVAS